MIAKDTFEFLKSRGFNPASYEEEDDNLQTDATVVINDKYHVQISLSENTKILIGQPVRSYEFLLIERNENKFRYVEMCHSVQHLDSTLKKLPWNT